MNERVANVVRQMSVFTPYERLTLAAHFVKEGHEELAGTIAEQVAAELLAKTATARHLVGVPS